jgi:signal transduction histidine kinase
MSAPWTAKCTPSANMKLEKRCTLVTVPLASVGGTAVLVDVSSGFDRKAAKENRGLGLISMEERLKLLNGTFSIESQPKRGTATPTTIQPEAECGVDSG